MVLTMLNELCIKDFMNTEKNLIVVTHSGAFHPDDVFALTVLRQLHPMMEVVRTRDEEIIASGDIIVDVGGQYDGKRWFDHHQNSDDVIRPDGIAYSSAGLIWKSFGHHYVDSLLGDNDSPELHIDVYEMIYTRFVNPIDHEDNGVSFKDFDIGYIRTIQSAFVPSWRYTEESHMLEYFLKAMDYIKMMVEVEVLKLRKHLDAMDANGFVLSAIEKSVEDETLKRLKVVELPQWMPAKKVLVDTDINFVISPRNDKEWTVETIPVEMGSFERRVDLPEAGAGLKDEELNKAAGITDGIFVHKGRFIGVFGSRETCILMIERAMHEHMEASKRELLEKFNKG